MSLTENSKQVFLPVGCNRTQNLRFGPYTIMANIAQFLIGNLERITVANLRGAQGFASTFPAIK